MPRSQLWVASWPALTATTGAPSLDTATWRRESVPPSGRLYEEIGLRILRTGPDYLATGRVVVPPGRKLVLLAGSLASLLADGAHDPALHDALRGLPGAPA